MIAAAMDRREVVVERDGVALRSAACFGVVALDESAHDDESVPRVLQDRLAVRIDLDGWRVVDPPELDITAATIDEARRLLPAVTASDAVIEALCAAALAFGVDALRASQLALRVACAAAALGGRDRVGDDDTTLAARLVLAPRATRLPAPPPDEAPPAEPPPPPPSGDSSTEPPPVESEQPLEDRVLEAVAAALPADLLQLLQAGQAPRGGTRSAGRAGAVQRGNARGRPAGVRRGELRAGARLSVIETLRAAAPWQPLRQRESLARTGTRAATGAGRGRLEVRRDDFRIARFRTPTRTTTIFVVDASGSQALNRLAEAKGAVELLLADCYVRRDQVSLIAFRGRGAELLLPPTRSLVRARRSLAQLPGGGGTPLASGIDAAAALALAARRRGETPVVILLTDGRANVARDGAPGRPGAEKDALASAQAFRREGLTSLLIDTSPRPQDVAARVAREMGGRYVALPFADANALSRTVRSSLAASTPRP
jgi:magnesium chelatase subunit D